MQRVDRGRTGEEARAGGAAPGETSPGGARVRVGLAARRLRGASVRVSVVVPRVGRARQLAARSCPSTPHATRGLPAWSARTNARGTTTAAPEPWVRLPGFGPW